MINATLPIYRIAALKQPGFKTTLNSEWTKLRTVRSTWMIVGLATVLPVVFSALVALVLGLTSEPFDTWSEADRVLSDPITGSMAGMLFSLILLIMLGVTSVGSEYSSGIIRTTFIVNPHRLRVGAAKALIVALLGIAINTIAIPGMFLVSQAIYGAYELETANITDSDAVRFLLVAMLVVPLTFTLIPLSLAYLLRRTASAMTAAIGLLFLPSVMEPALPSWIQEHILRFHPDIATGSISGYTPPDSMTLLTAPVASIVVAMWIVGLLAAAAAVLVRRDV